MPKVKPLTEEQRRAQRCERNRQMLADGMAAYKNRTNKTNEQIGLEFGVAESTVGKILHAKNVKLPIDALFNLWAAAGIEVKRRELPEV